MADAVFIRHKMSSTRLVLEELWAKRLIAIHYGDNWSTDPKDYDPSGKSELSRLWQYCESGTVVGAVFRRIRPSSMLVGKIPVGSTVEANRFQDPSTGEEFIYKTVALRKVKEISFADYPLLAAIQPPWATITGWPSAATYLASILRNDPVPWEVRSLHPSQLEVLCYEFMRQHGYLVRLLLPIGRGMIDVDICGLDESGTEVFAQVTQSTSVKTIKNKVERLDAFCSNKSRLYLFAPKSVLLSDCPRIICISIEEVFSKTEKNSVDITMIEKMLGYKKEHD